MVRAWVVGGVALKNRGDQVYFVWWPEEIKSDEAVGAEW